MDVWQESQRNRVKHRRTRLIGCTHAHTLEPCFVPVVVGHYYHKNTSLYFFIASRNTELTRLVHGHCCQSIYHYRCNLADFNLNRTDLFWSPAWALSISIMLAMFQATPSFSVLQSWEWPGDKAKLSYTDPGSEVYIDLHVATQRIVGCPD